MQPTVAPCPVPASHGKPRSQTRRQQHPIPMQLDRRSYHPDNTHYIVRLLFAIISPLKADLREMTFSPLGSFQCKSLTRTCLFSDLIQLYLSFKKKFLLFFKLYLEVTLNLTAAI